MKIKENISLSTHIDAMLYAIRATGAMSFRQKKDDLDSIEEDKRNPEQAK